MKIQVWIGVVGLSILLTSAVAAAEPLPFTRNLKLGDRGQEVLQLQQILNRDHDTQIAEVGFGSPGKETDYFGSLTVLAVKKFQEKYRREVLYPAGLFAPTGYVGFMTRAKLTALVSPFLSGNKNATSTQTNKLNPLVFSVYPDHARPGDTVVVTGENFAPTGNSVVLGDSYISKRFENLPSSDGKTISFTYQPPSIKTMSESEMRALPSDFVGQIESSARAAGATLADVAIPYKGIQSESELRSIIEKYGLSADAVLNHHFWITVENTNGKGLSSKALLYGLRKFPFDTVALDFEPPVLSEIKDTVVGVLHSLLPTAHAQFGGGFTSGVVFVCTCSGSLLTFQLDTLGVGTGLYSFPPGFVPITGSGLVAGPWIGGYIIGAGTCTFYVGLSCSYIYSNMPMLPVGYLL
jgi:peptidoglycan hydrolase-like protein with peptidoglycan-binding domain